MIGRIVRSADFERVLGAPSRARSSHFVVHHLAANPTTPKKPAKCSPTVELSTGAGDPQAVAVDDSSPAMAKTIVPAAPSGAWLGTVVPKRHAKRSVTRSLLKRHIHAAFAGQEALLPAGLWVVRLRAPFDRKQFKSAASEALHLAAREELALLMTRVLGAAPRR
ncbi:ribonuclease P protein component [Roseateles toxinivorans]|uniref:Ribonuclease P protein component n=1 Tax=Roseateles toxinivorans TaxID=270368 RepID=A0A4R6QQY8_9BURK|nr:ribonuclease P protein component [Roseateles toxinivorans]TDP72518.1 ribonuclease P protein component [Roseateles toxinivorans]